MTGVKILICKIKDTSTQEQVRNSTRTQKEKYVDLENLRSAASSVSTAVAPAGSITAGQPSTAFLP